MARVIGDVEVLGTGVGEVIVETWDTLLFSVALITVMLMYDPTLGTLALIPVPAALLLAKVSGRWVTARTLRARQADANLTMFVQEGWSGSACCGRPVPPAATRRGCVAWPTGGRRPSLPRPDWSRRWPRCTGP